MNSKDVSDRLMAAQKLIFEATTSREKFTQVSALVKGINTRIDDVLVRCEKLISTIEMVQQGDVIELSVGHLPEETEQDKRRKKAILLLIHSWKDLQGEIGRVQYEMQTSSQSSSFQSGGRSSRWVRILKGAKGPLGIITVLAVCVVALQQTSVQVTIENHGCPTLYPGGSLPSLPGFSLPKDPLASGSSEMMTIPPLALSIDGTNKGALSLTSLNYSFTFQLPSTAKDVTLDGLSLLGKTSEVHLSDAKQHVLVLQCM